MASSKVIHIVIVGAGVAGLTCARRLTHLLKHQSYRITILEARDRIGGRTLSIPELNLDLGASWNFPDQSAVRALSQELSIDTIEQYETGDSLISSSNNAIQRMNLYDNFDDTKRFRGGTGSLCAAMFDELTKQNPTTVLVQLNSVVASILNENNQTITIHLQDNRSIIADYVVLAVPPKLLVSTIQLTPSLPKNVTKQLSECITWMGSMCKGILVYDQPWWRDRNLSGFAVSRQTASQEWHDASSETCHALFAFSKAGTTQQQLIDDTVRIFGQDAAKPTTVYMTDWSNERFTSFSKRDGFDGNRHLDHKCRESQWNGRLWLGNSELSDIGNGVLEGAVRRGTQVANEIAKIV